MLVQVFHTVADTWVFCSSSFCPIFSQQPSQLSKWKMGAQSSLDSWASSHVRLGISANAILIFCFGGCSDVCVCTDAKVTCESSEVWVCTDTSSAGDCNSSEVWVYTEWCDTVAFSWFGDTDVVGLFFASRSSRSASRFDPSRRLPEFIFSKQELQYHSHRNWFTPSSSQNLATHS